MHKILTKTRNKRRTSVGNCPCITHPCPTARVSPSRHPGQPSQSMSVSERATARITTLPERERPLSEEFRIVAKQYADADAAASLMEELKGPTLAKMISDLVAEMPGTSEARAERMAKASSDWLEYLKTMCASRATATKLRLQLEWVRMRHREWVGADANKRHEAKL